MLDKHQCEGSTPHESLYILDILMSEIGLKSRGFFDGNVDNYIAWWMDPLSN